MGNDTPGGSRWITYPPYHTIFTSIIYIDASPSGISCALYQTQDKKSKVNSYDKA